MGEGPVPVLVCADDGGGAPHLSFLGSCCLEVGRDRGGSSCCHGASSHGTVVEAWLCLLSQPPQGSVACSVERVWRGTWRVCSHWRRRFYGSYCCYPALTRR